MSGEWWGFIFLMLIMKVPIAYLAIVVWYACKAPDPPEPALKLVAPPETEPECPWRLRRGRPRRPRHPHAPTPRAPRSGRVSYTRAERE
jgi:hypothetical protein